MRYTVGHLVQYVENNRRGKGFDKWTTEQLINDIAKAIDDKLMFYSADATGNINGLVIGKLESDKTIFVSGILTTGRGIMKRFIKSFKTMYPDHNLKAERKSKVVYYNTAKLVNKILHI